MFRRLLSILLIITFIGTSIILPQKSYAQGVLGLPEAGAMVSLSSAFEPVMIKGLKIDEKNPLNLDFIVSTGNSDLSASPRDEAALRLQSDRLIKYFFAALTLPEHDVWVNLSPYEKDRIIPEATGETQIGRDMLAQDYILKQITASLIYPEKGIGQEFWNKVYAQSQAQFGTTDIPVNTFNKVWITADTADVYESKNTVMVTDTHLKVMLEEDYLALQKKLPLTPSLEKRGKQGVEPPLLTKKEGIEGSSKEIATLGSQIVREIVLPALEKEVNSGKNFANLRQIFHSLILAKWYKENLKTALLNQVYSNKNKVAGVDVQDKTIKEQIYQQYLAAYKKGVFNYIKEDVVPSRINTKSSATKEALPAGRQESNTIARKYFSGGITAAMKIGHSTAAQQAQSLAQEPGSFAMVKVTAAMDTVGQQIQQKLSNSAAMLSLIGRYGEGVWKRVFAKIVERIIRSGLNYISTEPIDPQIQRQLINDPNLEHVWTYERDNLSQIKIRNESGYPDKKYHFVRSPNLPLLSNFLSLNFEKRTHVVLIDQSTGHIVDYSKIKPRITDRSALHKFKFLQEDAFLPNNKKYIEIWIFVENDETGGAEKTSPLIPPLRPVLSAKASLPRQMITPSLPPTRNTVPTSVLTISDSKPTDPSAAMYAQAEMVGHPDAIIERLLTLLYSKIDMRSDYLDKVRVLDSEIQLSKDPNSKEQNAVALRQALRKSNAHVFTLFSSWDHGGTLIIKEGVNDFNIELAEINTHQFGDHRRGSYTTDVYRYLFQAGTGGIEEGKLLSGLLEGDQIVSVPVRTPEGEVFIVNLQRRPSNDQVFASIMDLNVDHSGRFAKYRPYDHLKWHSFPSVSLSDEWKYLFHADWSFKLSPSIGKVVKKMALLFKLGVDPKIVVQTGINMLQLWVRDNGQDSEYDSKHNILYNIADYFPFRNKPGAKTIEEVAQILNNLNTQDLKGFPERINIKATVVGEGILQTLQIQVANEERPRVLVNPFDSEAIKAVLIDAIFYTAFPVSTSSAAMAEAQIKEKIEALLRNHDKRVEDFRITYDITAGGILVQVTSKKELSPEKPLFLNMEETIRAEFEGIELKGFESTYEGFSFTVPSAAMIELATVKGAQTIEMPSYPARSSAHAGRFILSPDEKILTTFKQPIHPLAISSVQLTALIDGQPEGYDDSKFHQMSWQELNDFLAQLVNEYSDQRVPNLFDRIKHEQIIDPKSGLPLWSALQAYIDILNTLNGPDVKTLIQEDQIWGPFYIDALHDKEDFSLQWRSFVREVLRRAGILGEDTIEREAKSAAMEVRDIKVLNRSIGKVKGDSVLLPSLIKIETYGGNIYELERLSTNAIESVRDKIEATFQIYSEGDKKGHRTTLAIVQEKKDVWTIAPGQEALLNEFLSAAMINKIEAEKIIADSEVASDIQRLESLQLLLNDPDYILKDETILKKLFNGIFYTGHMGSGFSKDTDQAKHLMALKILHALIDNNKIDSIALGIVALRKEKGEDSFVNLLRMLPFMPRSEVSDQGKSLVDKIESYMANPPSAAMNITSYTTIGATVLAVLFILNVYRSQQASINTPLNSKPLILKDVFEHVSNILEQVDLRNDELQSIFDSTDLNSLKLKLREIREIYNYLFLNPTRATDKGAALIVVEKMDELLEYLGDKNAAMKSRHRNLGIEATKLQKEMDVYQEIINQLDHFVKLGKKVGRGDLKEINFAGTDNFYIDLYGLKAETDLEQISYLDALVNDNRFETFLYLDRMPGRRAWGLGLKLYIPKNELSDLNSKIKRLNDHLVKTRLELQKKLVQVRSLHKIRLTGSLSSSSAMKRSETIQGGIDLDSSKFTIEKSGTGVEIRFNPAIIEQFKRGDFKGILPIITSITPISNIYPLIGLRREEDHKLAKV